MKIGERGQVTIPKEFREKFGLKPMAEVEFEEDGGQLVIKKVPRKLNLAKWKGHCRRSFEKMGLTDADEFIEEIRGR